jgi:hypothetical protein
LSFVPRQHEEENDDEQSLVIVFCKLFNAKFKKFKTLTKGGKVESVCGDIGDGDGTMEPC